MKKNIPFVTLVLVLSVLFVKAQCTAGFIYAYTGSNNSVWFQDKSATIQAGWQKNYTNWQFSDGSPVTTGSVVIHTFPQAQTYKVIMESKFSDPSNPANQCVVKDSLFVNAALAVTPCTNTVVKMKVNWLSDSTYGVSSYYTGAGFQLKEACVVYGLSYATTPAGPISNSIFSTGQDYFTFTLPRKDSNYMFVKNVISIPSCSATYLWAQSVHSASIPVTPSGCHASFFLMPSDTTQLNWTLLNYSSGSGALSYFWNFGDGNTSTSATPSHTYSQPGNYTVCLTVSAGTCTSTYCNTAYTNTMATVHGMKTIKVQQAKPLTTVSLSESVTKSVKMELYPNPVKENLTVSYSGDFLSRPVFSLHNMLGQQMPQPESRYARHDNNAHYEVLNTETLAPGIYLLEARFPDDQGQSVWQKFIKE